MKTVNERIQDLEKIIIELEGHIKNGKATKVNQTKAQAYLDKLEKEFPPRAEDTPRELLAAMYEMQALIDFSKGDLKRARAFVGEAKSTAWDREFASETIAELAEMGGLAAGGQGGGIPFFVTSAWRFVAMSILTFGFYGFYWFYKNWKILQDTTGKRQYPILSAIFSDFVSYRLFRDINKAAEERGHGEGFSAGLRAVLFFLLGALALININTPMEQAGGVRANKFTPGETAMIIISAAFWALFIIGGLTADDPNYYDYSSATQHRLVVNR